MWLRPAPEFLGRACTSDKDCGDGLECDAVCVESGEGEGEGEPAEPILLSHTSVAGLATALVGYAPIAADDLILNGTLDVANQTIDGEALPLLIDGTRRLLVVRGDVSMGSVVVSNCAGAEVFGVIVDGALAISGVLSLDASCGSAESNAGAGTGGSYQTVGEGPLSGSVVGTSALAPLRPGFAGGGAPGAGGHGGGALLVVATGDVNIATGSIVVRGGDGVDGGGGGSGGAVLIESPSVEGDVTRIDVSGGGPVGRTGGRGRIRLLVDNASQLRREQVFCPAEVSLGQLAEASDEDVLFDDAVLPTPEQSGRSACVSGTCFSLETSIGEQLRASESAAIVANVNDANIVQLNLTGNAPVTTANAFGGVADVAFAAGEVVVAGASGGVRYGSITSAPEGGGEFVLNNMVLMNDDFPSAMPQAIVPGQVVVGLSNEPAIVELDRSGQQTATLNDAPADVPLRIASNGDQLLVVYVAEMVLFRRTAAGEFAFAFRETVDGTAVADLSFVGDTIAVGLPQDASCGTSAGLVRIYHVDASNGFVLTDTVADERRGGLQFGNTVALHVAGEQRVLAASGVNGFVVTRLSPAGALPRAFFACGDTDTCGGAAFDQATLWMASLSASSARVYAVGIDQGGF